MGVPVIYTWGGLRPSHRQRSGGAFFFLESARFRLAVDLDILLPRREVPGDLFNWDIADDAPQEFFYLAWRSSGLFEFNRRCNPGGKCGSLQFPLENAVHLLIQLPLARQLGGMQSQERIGYQPNQDFSVFFVHQTLGIGGGRMETPVIYAWGGVLAHT